MYKYPEGGDSEPRLTSAARDPANPNPGPLRRGRFPLFGNALDPFSPVSSDALQPDPLSDPDGNCLLCGLTSHQDNSDYD